MLKNAFWSPTCVGIRQNINIHGNKKYLILLIYSKEATSMLLEEQMMQLTIPQ